MPAFWSLQRPFRYANQLPRHGLVPKAIRQRTRTEDTALSQGLAPNDLWCTGYKGEFMLGDKCYPYPLTITDDASRACSYARQWNGMQV